MNSRLIVPALLSALMVSAPAMATGLASPKGTGPSYPHQSIASDITPGAKCAELEAQFDQTIKSHKTSGMASQAMTLRNEAGLLCSSGKQDDGIAKLKTALQDIGVKPRL